MDQEQINQKICNAFQAYFVGIEYPAERIPHLYKAVTHKYIKTGESIDNIVSDLAYRFKFHYELRKSLNDMCDAALHPRIF